VILLTIFAPFQILIGVLVPSLGFGRWIRSFVANLAVFVVVGMSFECEADKYLLRSISGVQDDLPIGESSWYILNPNGLDLANTAQRISVALPRAKITMLHKTFRAWLDEKFPELHACGALN